MANSPLNIPTSMKVINITEHGGAEKLQLIHQPLPTLSEDYLLVKVEAAGVNRPDIFQRMGFYPPPPDASPILGLEIAGTIVAKANNVEQWQVGEQHLRASRGVAATQSIVWFIKILHCR
ncbi:alcohol dehydrogenase catalytic domain-containing protein [Providencia vermicola]|uniref:alcohol dehydrogenase catalytic domain-containing protein n=1 Tax=Providencia vermicola TaxID=333965 RepID=UPI003F79E88C